MLLVLVLVPPAQAADHALPQAGGQYDSQLGGAYPLPSGTLIVSRDREEPPAEGAYNICYVNAFQTQPQDADWWRNHHPGLLLQQGGLPIEDASWPGEFLLDTSTPDTRAGLMAVVSDWIKGCARDGFDAIEADNLDTFSRSGGLLSIEDNLAFARDLIVVAHSLGLAVAQKNGAELGARGPAAGFDFVITESCQVWNECGAYIVHYGSNVLDIEYSDTGRHHFDEACARFGANISVILRDRNLTSPDDAAYIYQAC